MPDEQIQVDGDDSFEFGVNSFTSPGKLMPGQYVMGMNLINRGGVAQTRPGSASLPFTLMGTNVQGMTMFKPTTGPVSLVFVIDGLVYYSPSPFREYFQIPGLQFSPYAKYIAWASCVQSTDYTPDGVIHPLDETRNVLIIQDGHTRAAYWDGGTAAHINPTPHTGEFTEVGTDGTPQGLWMKWSNNRLWVSRGNMVFASDIGNPLKFSEAQYLNEGRAFYLPGECTGIVETTDQQGIVCFTNSTGTFLRTSIQARNTWLTTVDFQKTVLPYIGCTAPRSIVQQHGLVWWWTPRGLINQDDASKSNISSRINVQDQEMMGSKSNVSFDISLVAGASFENFLFHAVPNGSKMNTRLHVLDQAPSEDNPVNSWPSYWEGWRPVEFAKGIITNQERIFCISYDYDGKIRIWELFLPNKTDNGIPITSYIQTKNHFFGNRDYKRFRYAEVEMVNVSGEVAVMLAVAGIKGAYQTVGTKDVAALHGQIYDDVLYGFGANDLMGSRSQTRVIRSSDGSDPSECNEECVESEHRGLIDKCFSLLIVWSGIAGVSAYRLFALSEPTAYQGTCENDETGETRLLTETGCSSSEVISGKQGFERFLATATFSRINQSTGNPVTNTSSAESFISQEDANRKASRTAEFYVMSEIGELV